MTTEINKVNKKFWKCLEYILNQKSDWISTSHIIKHQKKNIPNIEDILKKCTYPEIDGKKGNFYNRTHVETMELLKKILYDEIEKEEQRTASATAC
jgi:hypothetical protein